MKTTLNVNFTKFNTNKKDETVLEFQVRGDLTDEQILSLHKLKAAGTVTLNIGSSQMDLDDVYSEPREGVRGKINEDGTVESVEGRQMTLEEAPPADDEIEDENRLPGLEDDDDDADPMDGVDEGEAAEGSEDNDPDAEPEDEQSEDDDQLVQEAAAAEPNNDELPGF